MSHDNFTLALIPAYHPGELWKFLFIFLFYEKGTAFEDGVLWEGCIVISCASRSNRIKVLYKSTLKSSHH
jgi:hypothetical protein